MLKKKVIPIAKTSIGLKCGDCLHFKTNAKFERPCADLGVKRFSEAPACYSPNVYSLGRMNPDVLYQLGFLLKDFTAQDLRIFLSLLKQGTAMEKHYNLKFGQPVYFCLGADYLSNYFTGFVIGVAESGDGQVFVGSDLKGRQRGKPLTGSFLRDSVFSSSEFVKRKAQLIKSGRINDPAPLFNTVSVTKSTANVDYEPPSMDSAPPEWFNKDTPVKGKAGRTVAKKAKKKGLDGKLEFMVSRAS